MNNESCVDVDNDRKANNSSAATVDKEQHMPLIQSDKNLKASSKGSSTNNRPPTLHTAFEAPPRIRSHSVFDAPPRIGQVQKAASLDIDIGNNDGKIDIVLGSTNAKAATPTVNNVSKTATYNAAYTMPVPQTQLRMRRVNSTPCVSSSFSDSNDATAPAIKSTDQVAVANDMTTQMQMHPPAASPKHMYLADSPMKLASPNFANIMASSPTLAEVAKEVLKNFPANSDKLTADSILKSSPPTPFPELDMNQANNKHIDAMMMSPGTGGEMTPRSADPAFSWFNVNSPSLKSPKMIGNTSFFTGNFFSDAADLGFEKNQSPAPYLKQNAKLPFSPVSTKMVNKQQKKY